MSKSLLFRFLGVGAIPKKLRPVLDAEQIVVADEGIGGWLICKDVKGPKKRFINRAEGFWGCLVVTKKRIVCFTYRKRQINIAIDDPKISKIFVDIPKEELLSISFESSAFRDGWGGIMEFRFKTTKALEFRDVLMSFGAQQGAAPDGDSAALHTCQ
jgi:hypothetical protein